MSRERPAACPLAADQLSLLMLHRHVPERSLPELLAASECLNDPARAAMCHLASCATCARVSNPGTSPLCRRGAHLIAASHAWRPRAIAR